MMRKDSQGVIANNRKASMLASIFIPIVFALSLGIALRWPRDEQLINRRAYNNRYSDATAAREDYWRD